MYWLNGNMAKAQIWSRLGDRLLDLQIFTVTIRHSDWWFKESDEPLQIDVQGLRHVLCQPKASRLSEFRLELKTLEWRMNQLGPILERLKSLSTCKSEECEDAHWKLIKPFEETTWSGPTNIGDEDHDIFAKRDKLDYRIVTVK
jgi:hypothetical protein